MTDVQTQTTANTSQIVDGLSRVLFQGMAHRERGRLLGQVASVTAARIRAGSTNSHWLAEILDGMARRLPIRSLTELQKSYGQDRELTAAALIEDSAKHARVIWTAAAAIPGPSQAVHTIKVIIHSALEVRLVGELYVLYGETDSVQDPTWLASVLHAWAVGHPVSDGAQTIGTVRKIASRLQDSYERLQSERSRIGNLFYRGEEGRDAIRSLGQRFRRRLRPDPAAWPRAEQTSTLDLAKELVTGVVRSKTGVGAADSTDDPKAHLKAAWLHHRLACREATLVLPDSGNAQAAARLVAALDAQQQYLLRLSKSLHSQPPTATPAPPGSIPSSRPEGLKAAHRHIGLSDDAIDLVEEAGARPRRLRGWPAPIRNGLVYVLAAVLTTAPVVWLVAESVDTEHPLTLMALLMLPSCGLGLLSYGVAMVVIGPLFRPILGGRVARSPFLGFVVTVFAASLVSGAMALATRA